MDAIKRYEEEVGHDVAEATEDHLDLTLEEEFEVIQKYKKILKIDEN